MTTDDTDGVSEGEEMVGSDEIVGVAGSGSGTVSRTRLLRKPDFFTTIIFFELIHKCYSNAKKQSMINRESSNFPKKRSRTHCWISVFGFSL